MSFHVSHAFGGRAFTYFLSNWYRSMCTIYNSNFHHHLFPPPSTRACTHALPIQTNGTSSSHRTHRHSLPFFAFQNLNKWFVPIPNDMDRNTMHHRILRILIISHNFSRFLVAIGITFRIDIPIFKMKWMEKSIIGVDSKRRILYPLKVVWLQWNTTDW